MASAVATTAVAPAVATTATVATITAATREQAAVATTATVAAMAATTTEATTVATVAATVATVVSGDFGASAQRHHENNTVHSLYLLRTLKKGPTHTRGESSERTGFS
jgi:hypothetical protein